jgi:sensor c-di-GMP phosphodiesterase-like protein
VQAIGTETVTSPVLDAVLTLSRRLKLMTVAEGVETQEQAEWLRARAFISCRATGSADRCRWKR